MISVDLSDDQAVRMSMAGVPASVGQARSPVRALERDFAGWQARPACAVLRTGWTPSADHETIGA